MSDSPVELMNNLLVLTKDWNQHDSVPEDQQERCKAIGRGINAAGGLSLMQSAYQTAHASNQYASVVQAYWDGIGYWRW